MLWVCFWLVCILLVGCNILENVQKPKKRMTGAEMIKARDAAAIDQAWRWSKSTQADYEKALAEVEEFAAQRKKGQTP